MQITARHYDHARDYERVGEFLVRTYDPGGGHVNWLQPRWEYMHYLPQIEEVDLSVIGLWEASGEIVGVVHPEHFMGTAYFEVDPAAADLKSEMLAWAEEHVSAVDDDGGRALTIYVNDRDEAFGRLAAAKGYVKQGDGEAMSHFVIGDSFPAIRLPEGFRLQSLADDNDMRKVHRALHRGFDHGDEPTEDGIEARTFMQSAPNFREDLNIVVVAPDGNFVCYGGMWYEPVNRIGYVEPVATDPDYRRRGLASAAVLESIRRCGRLGATVAYVGTDKPLYLAIGFVQIYNRSAWRREWASPD